jgi:16S rRNA C967 or C1407 C5-methylase (RsmB/RsmF family)/NOL1/NOP2/fmu family ribosome biogenesis protein
MDKKPSIPLKFLNRMESLLGDEFPSFKSAIEGKPNVSVRYNPNKNHPTNLNIDTDVKWCKDAFYLAERPSFVFDPYFHCGSYYVQEASSMIIDHIFRTCLDLNQPQKVLDLCAAPGGKSSLVLSLLNKDSLLISNELVGSRARVLKENLDRWGYANNIVANNRADAYSGLNNFLDAVVLDAPCSGEGMFRKHDLSIEQWSQKKIDELSSIQRDLLSLMAPLIRDNGIIIYSTCTHALEEDEKNVEWFLEQFPAFEQVQIDLEEAWGISNQIAAEHYPEIAAAYRMFFHKARGEGFFFSVFRKKEGHAGRFKNSKKNTTSLKPLDNKTKALFTSFLNHPEDFELRKDGDEIYALPIKYVDDILILDSRMRLIKKGIHLGTSKGKKWIPTHDFALSNIIKRSAFPIIEIGHEDALRYYKGMNLESENKLEQGWALIAHNDNILGWVKVLPNRINNHLPKGWEIRKPLEF